MTARGAASVAVRMTLVLVLLGIGAGGAWAIADDASRIETMPAGTIIAGHDVAGMTLEQARTLIEREVTEPLLAVVTVRADETSLSLDPSEFVHVDVDAMLEAAVSPSRTASLAERAWSRVSRSAPGTDVPVLKSVDEAALQLRIDEYAKDLDEKAVDASLTVEGSAVKIAPSKTGRKVKKPEATAMLAGALLEGDKDVTLPLARMKPKVHEDSFGKTIVVRISERRLYLYDGDELEKKYGVAVGTPGHPTPRGEFEIELKRFMPTWSNPGSDWAKSMPKTIPPGPNNPLGTRALNLNISGIRIHGTTADSSIGTAASHGCMRMHRWDIEDLYPRVEVGTRVFVVS